MAKIWDTPDFKSYEEEANWWDNNQELVLREFKEAAKDGTLQYGTIAKRFGITATIKKE